MKSERLSRAAEEIKDVLDTALYLPGVSSKAFNQIAQPLRRALRLLKREAKNKDADEVTRLRGMIQYATDAPDEPESIKKILRDALSGRNGWKASRAIEDAELLFDVMQSGVRDVVYEIGCVLDEHIESAERVYESPAFFVPMYLAATKEGSHQTQKVKAILRDLKKGVPASDIARQLKEGTFNVKGGRSRG